MKRREFMALVAAISAVGTLEARAQRAPMPVIGFLNGAFAEGYTKERAAFLGGLDEAGYIDGRNVLSNIVGLRVKPTGYQRSRMNWCSGKSQ